VRVLAVDPGTKRIGLAVSDPLGITANPIDSLAAAPADTLAERIAAIARERQAEKVVVGLPRRLDGSDGPEAAAARRLADEIRRATRLPVSLYDERLTSVAAERAMLDGGVRRARRRELSDQVAAAMILRSFLDAEGARRGR
jgi:putative Holliday junction resolvase